MKPRNTEKEMKKKLKRELKSKTVTTTWEYNDRTVIHSKVKRKPDLFYFNGTDFATDWEKDNGFWIEPPKGTFITRFKGRVKNFFKILK